MMSQYKITQEEFKTLSELKHRFGNVSLVDLYNQSTVIDANGNAVPGPKMSIPSIEEACKTLSDKQIEELLGDKIGNMCIYAHYDLAEHQAGLLSPHYNGERVEFLRFGDNKEPKIIKSALEAGNREIELAATAVKTIQRASFSGNSRYTFAPRYQLNSPYFCGNIIFREKRTGKFYAMDAWICRYPIYDRNIKLAASWGLNQFMSYVAKIYYFRATVLSQISDILYRAHESQI